MVQEFEGRTEKEAIDQAIADLGIERNEFDVEIVDSQKAGFLGMGKRVKIRVHYDGGGTAVRSGEAEDDFEHGLVDFVHNVTEKMGYSADVRIAYREDNKIGLKLDSKHSNILIGRKGKNLDAIQLLANVVAGRLGHEDIKVVVDAENYRNRREESLIRLAHKVGDEVKRSGGSKLLEPMNPFERRLIHTTLNDVAGIATRSEGEGLYKQVRVYYTGDADR
ncbi:MAG: RNA-binding cell elongation regulator Jag/EloR [Spirochaetaceae bacterium]